MRFVPTMETLPTTLILCAIGFVFGLKVISKKTFLLEIKKFQFYAAGLLVFQGVSFALIARLVHPNRFSHSDFTEFIISIGIYFGIIAALFIYLNAFLNPIAYIWVFNIDKEALMEGFARALKRSGLAFQKFDDIFTLDDFSGAFKAKTFPAYSFGTIRAINPKNLPLNQTLADAVKQELEKAKPSNDISTMKMGYSCIFFSILIAGLYTYIALSLMTLLPF